MKRYSLGAASSDLHGAYMETDEDSQGEWVKWEDAELLLTVLRAVDHEIDQTYGGENYCRVDVETWNKVKTAIADVTGEA